MCNMQRSLRTFCHFDITLDINHRVYYKEDSDEFLPSLGHDVSCELSYSWFICAPF